MKRILIAASVLIATSGSVVACPGGDAFNYFCLFFWQILAGIAAAGGYWG